MRTNVIVLCKNKLVGVDSFMPIVMELHAAYPNVRMHFVFLNNRHRSLVQKNYHLWRALQSIGASTWTMGGTSTLHTAANLVAFIMRCVLRRNVILKHVDTLPRHRFVIRFLKACSRTVEVKAYTENMSPRGYRNSCVEAQLLSERSGRPLRPKYFDGEYDYLLSRLSVGQFREFFGIETPPVQQIVPVGYTYRLPAWQRYLHEQLPQHPIVNDGPYFLYILSTLGKRFASLDEPAIGELLEESLVILRKYNNQIKTVFKPHAITDVDALQRILTSVGYSNYVIDYGHPMIFSAKAQFVFANMFSMTMFDAYYCQTPVVEYTQQDPEYARRMGERSFGGRCCDFYIMRDRRELERIVDRLVQGNVSCVRDPSFIAHAFPETPDAFYTFWQQLLADPAVVQ